MKSPSPIVADGGQKYSGRPWTRLFAFLSLFGSLGAIGLWISFFQLDSERPSASGMLWLAIGLSVVALTLIVVTIRFAVTEKSAETPPIKYDRRKLY